MGGLEEKEILVTGATGFVGSNLTAKLVESGAKVHIISRTEDISGDLILRDLARDDVMVCKCDLRDPEKVKRCVEEASPELVYHLGGVVDLARSFEIAYQCFSTNILGTLNLLSACEKVPLESFVFTSTCEVYESGAIPFREDTPLDPKSPYSISKVACEQICRFAYENYGIPVVILRLSTIYGPNQKLERLIPYTIISCLRKEGLVFTHGEQTRDFTYVSDVVEGIIKASLEKKAAGEIVNLGSEVEYSIREIVFKILDMMGCEREPEFGAAETRSNEPGRWVCDITKAKRMFRWTPETSIEVGLEKTIKWYEERYGGR